MRLGVVLEAPTIEDLVARALVAETAGIDLVWFTAGAGGEAALLSAAAVAARTSVIRLAGCVGVGGQPLAIAEAAVVCDNCSGGRVVLVLEDDENDSELLAESVDVVLAATAPRPFRHAGTRWRIPANLPENDHHEELIVVTPYAVQTELPVWLFGHASAPVARVRGLPHVAGEFDPPDVTAAAWSQTDDSLGLAARRLRRPAVRLLGTDERGKFDVDEIVGRLRADRRAWGLDTAVVHLPPDLDDDAWNHAIDGLALEVRPRVTMHELPAGLDEHWKQVLV